MRAFWEVAELALRSVGQYTLGVIPLLVCLGVFVPFVATYLFTVCRFYAPRAVHSRCIGKEPPTVPYWIPFVGSAFAMISDPHKFFEETL